MRLRSDLFARLNNGQRAQKSSIQVPFSKLNIQILQILQEEGFIHHWHLEKMDQLPQVWVFFKNQSSTNSAYQGKQTFQIKQISKKNRPIYLSAKNLWKLDRGLTLYILSTHRGLLTDRQARRISIGGELLCRVH